MNPTHKQTWWDKEIKNQFQEFQSWVGKSNALSKIIIRNLIKEKDYKSILDIGCGMCDDYFSYQKEAPEISWKGLDSSVFLTEEAKSKGIPVIHSEGDIIPLNDGDVDLSYSRHVLEHQETYKYILSEMIRVASKAVIHIFFIKPKEKQIINYNKDTNLYHNTYNKKEIEEWLSTDPKVKTIHWLSLTDDEEALIIELQ